MKIIGGIRIRKNSSLHEKSAIFRHAQKPKVFGGAANFVRVHAEKQSFSRTTRGKRLPKGENLRFSPGKGQFFIISAVIVASFLLIISHNFSGFSAVSLTENAEMSELEYIGMIKKSLNNTAAFSGCDSLDEEISAAEGFFSKKLAEQGIQMTAAHRIVSCGNVRLSFNLSSQNFFSSTEFRYP